MSFTQSHADQLLLAITIFVLIMMIEFSKYASTNNTTLTETNNSSNVTVNQLLTATNLYLYLDVQN